MVEIVQIGREQLFDLQEATKLLPTMQKITKNFYDENHQIENRLQRLVMADPRRRQYLEEFKVNVTQWKLRMEGLGVKASNMWKVQLDVGDGYLCWQYPQLVISHFLPYQEYWQNRIKLSDYIVQTDPDWAC